MRERRRRWALAAATLLGLLATALTAHAQPGGAFDEPPDRPDGPQGLEFPEPKKGRGADFPNPSKGPPLGPFEMSTDGEPNAFCGDSRPFCSPLRLWFKGEYLLWQMKPTESPINLVTTSSSPTLGTNIGALGQSGTIPLFGPGDLDYRTIDGGRLTLGLGFDILPPIEISGFWVGNPRNFFSESSDGSAGSRLLARPIRATQINTETAIFTFPGSIAGNVSVDGTIDMIGIDANIYLPIGASDVLQIDGYVGFRFQDLKENLNITNTQTQVSGATQISFGGVLQPLGNATSVVDTFATQNQFAGGTLGGRALFMFNRFALLVDSKLIMGPTRQTLRVAGSSTLTTPATPVRGETSTLPGGILAVPSNSGESSESHFTFINELGFTLGFEASHNIRLFAGFSAFHWSDVVRPGNQLSDVIDTRQVPTSPQFNAATRGAIPSRVFVRDEFWGYGLNFGIAIGF